MKRELLERLQALRKEKQAMALVTRLDNGQQALVNADTVDGELDLAVEIVSNIREQILEDLSGVLTLDATEFFVRIYNPPLRLIIIGAVHVTQALIPMAEILGFDVTVVDPRTTFATDARFPGVVMLNDWPNQAMRSLRPDHRTAVVTLTHDPKLDDPALVEALHSDAFYIGSLGSRRTHASRLERLRAEGIGEDLLERIHAPVGIHLGGRRPAEIALAVMAEIVRTLRLRQGE